MIDCPHCKRPNPEDKLFCLYCGQALDPLQKTPEYTVDNGLERHPRWGSARLTRHHRLLLRVVGAEDDIEVDVHERQSVILGRLDPLTDQVPDVDLGVYNGTALGVSRQHARLGIVEDTLHITDLGSTNGTFLNGKRLKTNQWHVLRDGDEIRLGGLKLHVLFVEAPDRNAPSSAR